MDNMFGPLGDVFDLNGDGNINHVEFGVMISVIESGEDPFDSRKIMGLDEDRDGNT